MPWFYVDDAFADSKPVMRLDERLRNEAIGLWVRCGAWSAKEETDGHVPLDVVRQFGGNKRLVLALANDAELWHPIDDEQNWRKTREILFKNWAKWQKTKAENERRRKQEAEKKRTYRSQKKGRDYVATSDDVEMSTRDAPPDTPEASETVSTRDSRDPDPTHTYTDTHLGNESSLNVGASERAGEHEFGIERGLSDPVPISASRMVARLIPREHPPAVLTALRLKASELVNNGTPADVVEAALKLWLDKPAAGPGLLPSLASEVIKARSARAGPPAGEPSAGDAKVAGWLGLGQPRPPQPPPTRGELAR